MNQNIVNLQMDAASVDNEQSFRQQIRNDEGPVSAFAVAEALGRALAVLQVKMAPQPPMIDDIVYAFRKGYTGETK